jgi:hypothetical protein
VYDQTVFAIYMNSVLGGVVIHVQINFMRGRVSDILDFVPDFWPSIVVFVAKFKSNVSKLSNFRYTELAPNVTNTLKSMFNFIKGH